MTEHQAPWIESDGVSSLPTVAGCYAMRCVSYPVREFFAYFDGSVFFNSALNEQLATTHFHTGCHEKADRGFFDAWRDYQGLMSKPAKKTFDITSLIGWKSNPFATPTIGIDWSSDVPIMASDEPGIQRAKYAEKFNDKPELVVTMVNGVECDPVELAAFLESQRPKPIPNTTPRGILTVWNERADHRLGQWNQTGNFAD